MSTVPGASDPLHPHAARISLEIAEIASRDPEPTTLARRLVPLLLAELGAGALAIFWREASARSGNPPGEPSGLSTLAAEARAGVDLPPLEAAMKAAARCVCGGAEPTVDSNAPVASGEPAATGRLLPLPLGTPRPWAVAAAWWPLEPGWDEVRLPGEELLQELQPSLTLATMPAHLLEAMQPALPSPESAGSKAQAASSFISMISHELRTPLHAINGFLEVVMDGQVGPLNPRQQEFLGYVQSSATQLTTLVEDILFISKADAGQFAVRPATITVDHLLHQAIQTVSQAAERAEITIETRIPHDLPVIWGDELRIRQVITNLLNNAIKFSSPGQEVTITLANQDAGAEFAVADHGPGISFLDQPYVFERFYQTETGQHAGGYGLGLAIAKLIIEQHGGRIWLASSPGDGATFSFTLPREPASIF